MTKIDLLISRIKDLAGKDEHLKHSTIRAVIQNTAFFLTLLASREWSEGEIELHLYRKITPADGDQLNSEEQERQDLLNRSLIEKTMLIEQAIRSVLDEEMVSAAASDPQQNTAANLTNEVRQTKTYKTALGRNIDNCRLECGWSFDDLANWTTIDKRVILRHVNEGTHAVPRILKIYADIFAKQLVRRITVADLLKE
jgi:hypothetical protein